MNREFFVNLVFLVAINLLIKPFYIFGIDRTVQNTVGAEDYGIYIALLNFTFLFQIINDFGIQQFNNRNIAQYNQLLEKYFPNILTLKLGLAAMYSLVVTLFAWFAGYLPEYRQILVFFIINQILSSLIFYLRSNVSGLGLYRTDSLLSILDRLILIFLCGYLLWFSPFRADFQIEWFIYAHTFSLSLTLIIISLVIRKHLRYLKFKFNPAFLLLIIKKSYPFALMIFLMTIYTRIDSVMIERMLPDGKYEAGAYGAAYRLLDALNMVAFLFASLLLPMFAKMLKEDRAGIPSLLKLSFQIIMAGAIPLTVATFFYQYEIMTLLYDEANQYWGSILGALILTFLAICVNYTYGTLLTANDKLRTLNFIFLFGFLINVGLNYYFILQYKALGATIATFITQFLMAFAQIFLVHYQFKFKLDIVLFLKIGLFILLTTFIIYTTNAYWLTDWKLKFVTAILLSLSLALVLRLVNIKYLLKLIRTK